MGKADVSKSNVENTRINIDRHLMQLSTIICCCWRLSNQKQLFSTIVDVVLQSICIVLCFTLIYLFSLFYKSVEILKYDNFDEQILSTLGPIIFSHYVIVKNIIECLVSCIVSYSPNCSLGVTIYTGFENFQGFQM